MTDWTPTKQSLPPEGVTVLTKDSGGQVRPLKRKGRLWFVPDMSMYVYYTPVAWKVAP